MLSTEGPAQLEVFNDGLESTRATGGRETRSLTGTFEATCFYSNWFFLVKNVFHMLLISELLTAVNNTLETWKVSNSLLTGHGISNITLTQLVTAGKQC